MFLIFDLDGTLLDTLADLGESHNLALVERGLDAIPIDDYRYLVGKGLRNLSERTLTLQEESFKNLSKEAQDAAVSQHLARFQVLYHEHLLDKTVPYPGIPELLAQLKDKGLDMAVLSNKADHLTKQLIEHFFPEHPFLFVEGMNEDWPRKPDATFALELCKQFAKNPAETVLIGDTSTDMQTATNAGFIPLGVSWGFRKRAELFEYGAVAVMDSPSELANYIFDLQAPDE